MSSNTTASPFTRAVVSSMRKLYPESLADKSFDNTGLLLEAPFHPSRRQMNSVLLTVDLTREVATEAIKNKHSCVVAYHPIIFRGLKSITLADSQQSSLLRLALEGVSVYCPHTAVDAVPGGMADWLCDIVTGPLQEVQHPEQETTASAPKRKPPKLSQPSTPGKQQNSLQPKSEDDVFTDQPSPLPTNNLNNRPHPSRSYSRPHYPQSPSKKNNHHLSNSPPLSPSHLPHTRTVLHPSPQISISATHNPTLFPSSHTGSGRLITFTTPQPLTHLIERIARGVGSPKGFPVAIPQSTSIESITIRTVGVCPGSGGSVLQSCGADLIFTGELAHHDALAVIERGGCVVSLFHSNSERGYLAEVMRARLEEEIKEQWGEVREGYYAKGEKEGGGEEQEEGFEEVFKDESVTVEVSRVDRDPFGIVVLQGSEVEGMKI